MITKKDNYKYANLKSDHRGSHVFFKMAVIEFKCFNISVSN